MRTDDPSFDISNRRDREALLEAERAHFWHQSRNHIIATRLASIGIAPGASILELGCGAGCVSAHLASLGYRVTGVDGHAALVDIAAHRAPEATFHCVDLRDESPPVAPASFDAAALFDVIEHMDEPLALLDQALGFVRPGGWLVGTVPALMLLWSPVDERAGHKTRHSTRSLRALLTDVRGVSTITVQPFNRALVPMMWLQRKMVGRGDGAEDSMRNLAVPWFPINRTLYHLVLLEDRLAKMLDRVGLEGSSLWFAMRKAEVGSAR